MLWLKKNWYVVLLAFVLSIGTNVALILLNREAWMPDLEAAEPVEEVDPSVASFVAWDFSMAEVETTMEQLREDEARLERRETELQRMEERIESELVELDRLRRRIEAQRDEMLEAMVKFEAAEVANIRKLSRIYSEMNAKGAVAILRETEMPLVVKIISGMDQEAAASVLQEMSVTADPSEIQRAARITELLRVISPD